VRLVCSADWQCSVTNLQQCLQTLNQICEILDDSPSPKFFIHAGDVKEVTNPVDQRVTNFIVEAFARINNHCDGVAFVTGNHDYINTQDGVPSCAPVVEASGARWVASDDWYHYPISKNPPPVHLFLVPFMRDSERQKQALEAAAFSAKSVFGKKILVFHNTIDGCLLNNSFKGVGIAKKDLFAEEYDLCIGGHIHKPQFIKPNIHYVGSPFAMDWSECNIQHRILVVDL
jgi:DNA repair exonuclease SbcCD nuclease subunit